MAIITQALVEAYSGTTFSGADATSVAAFATAVDDALKRKLYPYVPEASTLTDRIFDAPLSPDLWLPYPVRSITSIYYNPNAHGVVANFTSDHLLTNTNGADYQLVVDDQVNNLSTRGLVRRVGRTVWGWRHYSPPQKLATRLQGEEGALKVTYLAGPASVPKAIEVAAFMAVQLMIGRRTTGGAVTSNSWNGESLSLAGQVTAEAAIDAPEVVGLLRTFLPYHIGGGLV
jgi:hypothetical protein